MTWREAVDEAGHVVFGVHIGVGIDTVAQNEEGIWHTYPKPATGVRFDDIFKFRLAGYAALLATGSSIPVDEYLVDYQSVVTDMVNHEFKPIDEATARGLRKRYLDEVVARFSQPPFVNAIDSVAHYLQDHDGGNGAVLEGMVRSLLNTP